MVASPLTPRIIFTNDPYVASAGPNTDFNLNYEQFNQRALDRPNQNSLYLTSDSENIISLSFSIAGTALTSPGPNVILDFFDPTDEFESRIFSRDEVLIGRLTHYYIAFGTDSEFLNWSNFHYVTLQHAELVHDFNKPKTIRLHLIASFGIHEVNTDIFVENTKELQEIGDALRVDVSTLLRTRRETDDEVRKKLALQTILNEKNPKSFLPKEEKLKEIVQQLVDVKKELERVGRDRDRTEKSLYEAQRKLDVLTRRGGRDVTVQEYNRAKGERDRLKDQYNQQLASISSLQSSRSVLMQQQREVTQEITGLQSRRTQADLNRQVEEAREALEEAE